MEIDQACGYHENMIKIVAWYYYLEHPAKLLHTLHHQLLVAQSLAALHYSDN